MALTPGSLVRYSNAPECVGIILAVGETMVKVRWNDEDIVEWMPRYALEIIDV